MANKEVFVKEVVIATGVRRLMSNIGSMVNDVPAHNLGELVVREVTRPAVVDPQLIGDVLVRCVGQSSVAHNAARVIGLKAGLPIHFPAYAVQRNRFSGLQSVVNAYQNIRSKT